MRPKTFKRLMVLIAVFSLIGVASYFIWRTQVDRMAHNVVHQADRAAEAKEYGKAVELYLQHLQVVPDDVDVRIKYADILANQFKTQKHQQDAMVIFEDVLRQRAGRADVRRRIAELGVEMGQFGDARQQLTILLKSAQGDGHLEYLMGRCREEEREAAAAADYYRSAMDHQAPERLDAAQRLAALLRDPLGRPEEADRVIEAMVQGDPEDYRVYLERGRYRRRFELKGAADDFRKALALAPGQAETYRESAQLAERESGLDKAREILDQGLAAVPRSPALYLALADLERRAGRLDESIKVLEDALKAMPEQLAIRVQLAQILAARGDTGKLSLQIQEMKDSGVNQVLVDYFTAYNHINKNEFVRARQILASLQPLVARHAELKARVNMLLARCYGQLGEAELQWDAIQRAVVANSGDLQARLEWIQAMVNRGDLGGAIEQYRRVVEQVPQIRLRLARLLIARNQQRAPDQREWGEIDRLIDAAAHAESESAEPVVLRAVVLAEQGQTAKARDVLQTARSQFPKAVEPWTAESQVLAQEKKYGEALDVLDRARKALGDRVELRLGVARIWVRRGGREALAALRRLGEGLEAFPKENRRALLSILAAELNRQQDLGGAAGMLSRLVELDPESLDPHLNLFALAFQTADRAMIEREIEAIEKIDSLHGQYCRADYLIWQAGRSEDKAERERLRTDARALLAGLKTRRPDWAPIPLSMAKMEEQELAQGGLDEAQSREKRESLIITYLRAIDLGARDLAVLRRAVQLLFAESRGGEALQLMSRIPAVTQFADLGRLASRYAVENRDFQQAEAIARNAVKARPDDFQERLWLIRILLEGGQGPAAEDEARKAIADAKTDPNRWITLVEVLVLNKSPEKAEQAIRDAAANLPQAPLILAQCCEILGRNYQGADKADRAKQWFDEARGWFAKAQAGRKDPSDLTVDRQLAGFLLRTNQLAEAQKLLGDILGRKGGAAGATTTAWARRSLALTYISANPRQPAKALAILDAVNRQGAAADPEDLRVLAIVLDAQGTAEHHTRAVGILNTLVDQNLANVEDRFRLAKIQEADGDWTRAREQYRELILRSNNPADVEAFRRRPLYLSQFAESLLRHHQPGSDLDLAEIQGLIERLEQIQPDLLAVLVLQVKLDQARNRPEAATDRLRAVIERPGVVPAARISLAELADQIGQPELAEQILRQLAAESSTLPNHLNLIRFFVRHSRFDAVVDHCNSLWKQGVDHEGVARLAIIALADPNVAAAPAQINPAINRAVNLLEQGARENPRSSLYRFGLGNLYERLGEDRKAEEQYRAVIDIDDREGTASNNLAWLMALRGNSNDALTLVNKATRIQGSHPDFLDTRGVVYLTAGQGPDAVRDLEAAVAVQPSGPKLFHLTQAYLKVKDREKAKESWEKAKRQGLPKGLHKLEMKAYQKVLDELG